MRIHALGEFVVLWPRGGTGRVRGWRPCRSTSIWACALAVVRMREVPSGMSRRNVFSSPPLAIAGIVVGLLVGTGLLMVALALVAIGAALSAPTIAVLALAAAVGFVLDTTWLCLAVRRLARSGSGGDSEDGGPGEGWGGPGPDPVRPWSPSEDPDWWAEFEREFRAYLEARERAPVAG